VIGKLFDVSLTGFQTERDNSVSVENIEGFFFVERLQILRYQTVYKLRE